jgi:5-methylcytosine-specific restriction endonuclease McrA
MAVPKPQWLKEVIETAVLHVHHKTYARFRKELPEDLEVLCADCHMKKHAMSAIKPRFQRAG